MAVALERFSIREYAAKMRTTDFGKCWPFDGGSAEGGEIGCSLPPISLRRYRWWSDEIEADRSHQPGGEKLGGASGEIKLDRDELMSEPIEDGEEMRQTRAPSKSKQRGPKKRSITELFAVSPQIEAVEEEEDGDDGKPEEEQEQGGVEEDGLGAVNGGGDAPDGPIPDLPPNKRKEQIHNDKKKETTRRKNLMNYRNDKEEKNKSKVEICAAKKEKVHKPKMSCVVDISLLLQASVTKRRLGKTLIDHVDARKKKPPKVRSFSKKHSLKLNKTSKLITKNQRETAKVFPAHSILKNRIRTIHAKKTSFKGDADGGFLLRSCCESEKHVTFSDKNEILGHNKSSSPTELPQLQSLCKMFSDVLVASSAVKEYDGGDKLPTASERAQAVKENAEDVDTSVVESAVRFSSENGQSDTENTSLNETIDLNCAMKCFTTLNYLDPGESALSPRHSTSGSSLILNSTFKEGSSPEVGYQAEESSPESGLYKAEESSMRSSNSTSFPLAVGSCVTQSDAASTLTITRSLVSQHMAPCSVTSTSANESQTYLSIDPKLDSFTCSPEFQPMYNVSSKELMNSICSLVEPRKHGESGPASDSLSNCGDKRLNDGFIVLPLNSQGELIHSNSSGKFGFGDLFKKIADPKNRKDHVKRKEMFPGARNDRQDPASYPIASGKRITELLDFGRIEVEKHGLVRDTDRFVHQNRHPMGPSCYGCREYTQSYNWINREKVQADGNMDHGIQAATQTTMRLMGKNVTVGKSSKECRAFGDGKIWTDKEIITEKCPSTRVSDGTHSVRRLQQEPAAHPASGSSRENHLHLLRAPSNLYHLQRIDCQPQRRSSNGISTTIGNNGFEANRSTHHQLPPKELLNMTSKSIANYNSVTESVKMGHQMPVVVSHPRNICQQTPIGSTHCNHIQSLPHSTTTLHPTFPNRDVGNHVDRSSAHSSSHLPQWLLNAKQQPNQKNPCPSSNDQIAAHHPCSISGTNLLSIPPYPASIISLPLHTTDESRTCGSSTPPSSVQTPFIPLYQASKPSPAVNANYRDKIKTKDGRKFNFAYLKLLDRANINKKRPADRGDEVMRQVKKPNLTIHKLSNTTSGTRRREQLLGCALYGTGYPEAPAYGNKVMDIGLRRMNNDRDGLRIASGSTSLKFGCGSRLGPVKLRAGAKHILKPSQIMDQDSSRPIHSIIPFAIGSSSSNNPVPQKKAAKVYRF